MHVLTFGAAVALICSDIQGPLDGMSTPESPGVDTKWHSLTVEEALKALQTTDAGLSTAEAEKRLAEYGRNALTPPPKPTFLRRLWNQINT